MMEKQNLHLKRSAGDAGAVDDIVDNAVEAMATATASGSLSLLGRRSNRTPSTTSPSEPPAADSAAS